MPDFDVDGCMSIGQLGQRIMVVHGYPRGRPLTVYAWYWRRAVGSRMVGTRRCVLLRLSRLHGSRPLYALWPRQNPGEVGYVYRLDLAWDPWLLSNL